MGHVEGVFVSDHKTVSDAIGRHVYFGEILGKHSEIHGTLKKSDVTALTDDQSFIARAEEFKIVPMGRNPLEYLEEADD